MNKYEQALVDAVRQITKDNAARAASDARWLNGMLRDLAPQVIGQREYKMLTALLNCNGNRILAEAAKKPATARDAEVERLVQRLQSDFLLDEDAARRICALYLAGVTGNNGYIAEGDKQPAETPRQNPPRQQRAVPTPAPEPVPEAREAAPQPGRSAAARRYKNRRLRFVPMAIAALCGAYIFQPLVLDFFESVEHAGIVMRSNILIAVYLIAAIYCYIIAFPFDKQYTWLGKTIGFVIAIFADFVMAAMLAGGGFPWVLFADWFTENTVSTVVAERSVDILELVKAIGLLLLVPLYYDVALIVGFLIHGYPVDEKKTPPEYQDWLKEDNAALKVMYVLGLILWVGLIVKSIGV